MWFDFKFAVTLHKYYFEGHVIQPLIIPGSDWCFFPLDNNIIISTFRLLPLHIKRQKNLQTWKWILMISLDHYFLGTAPKGRLYFPAIYYWLGHGFFYLLNYITFWGISKCRDREKNKNKNWTWPPSVPIVHSSFKINVCFRYLMWFLMQYITY